MPSMKNIAHKRSITALCDDVSWLRCSSLTRAASD
jgi:hypothetical protein